MDKSIIKKSIIGILVLIIVIIVGYKIYKKMDPAGQINKFNIEYQGARAINISSNPSLMAMKKGYAAKAADIEEWKNNYLKQNKIDNQEEALEKFETEIDKKYSELSETLNLNIKNNIVGNGVNAFKLQNSEWERYIKTGKQILNDDNNTVDLTEKAEIYGVLVRSEIYFNIYNYLYNNEINPQFSSEFITNRFLDMKNSTDSREMQNRLIKEEAEINNINKKGNDIVNEASINQSSLTDAYNKVYVLWNEYLNKEYIKIKSTSKNKEIVIQEEKNWETFRKEMLNISNEEYPNNPQNKLSDIRMNIRLTEQQILNLLNYNLIS